MLVGKRNASPKGVNELTGSTDWVWWKSRWDDEKDVGEFSSLVMLVKLVVVAMAPRSSYWNIHRRWEVDDVVELCHIVGVYEQSMFTHLHDQETSLVACPYMHKQDFLDEDWRAWMVFWMIHMYNGFEGFALATLHLAVELMDRFLEKRIIERRHVEVLGAVSFWIADKFHSARETDLKHYCLMCNWMCTPEEVSERCGCLSLF